MSFLNPVSEPVLRFKSTDAGAPQINYNSRTAGDIKAVLKACLVDGYGAIESAGWTAVNEVSNIIELVSPSAAMSDYRLGIDDTSTTKTDWYYQYQNARINPTLNSPVKAFTFADKLHASNGWQLFVTERGIVFVELVQHSAVNKLSARITYWGQVKSALTSTLGANIAFFNVGQNATISNPAYFYSINTQIYSHIDTYLKNYIDAANSLALEGLIYTLDTAAVDLVSPIYLVNADKSLLIAQMPPLLSKIVNKSTDTYGVNDNVLDGRNVLSVCAGHANSNPTTAQGFCRTFLIPLDYWEY